MQAEGGLRFIRGISIRNINFVRHSDFQLGAIYKKEGDLIWQRSGHRFSATKHQKL